MKPRDLLVLPFAVVGIFFASIAIVFGGVWTERGVVTAILSALGDHK